MDERKGNRIMIIYCSDCGIVISRTEENSEYNTMKTDICDECKARNRWLQRAKEKRGKVIKITVDNNEYEVELFLERNERLPYKIHIDFNVLSVKISDYDFTSWMKEKNFNSLIKEISNFVYQESKEKEINKADD